MQGLLQKSVGWATQITMFYPGLKRGGLWSPGAPIYCRGDRNLKPFSTWSPDKNNDSSYSKWSPRVELGSPNVFVLEPRKPVLF